MTNAGGVFHVLSALECHDLHPVGNIMSNFDLGSGSIASNTAWKAVVVDGRATLWLTATRLEQVSCPFELPFAIMYADCFSISAFWNRVC